MRKKTATILWENVSELMLHHWNEINLYRLAKDGWDRFGRGVQAQGPEDLGPPVYRGKAR
jgi:hypothetical protein